MSKALVKDILRSIRKTKARFISIIAIVALGIGIFAGIKAASPDMKETADKYYADNNLMDINVISTIGLTDYDVYEISKKNGVEAVMPSKFADGLLQIGGKGLVDVDGSAFTCRAISLDFSLANNAAKGENDAAYMNRLTLLEGHYPSKPNECVIDKNVLATPEELKIGSVLSLKGDRENLSNKLKVTEFKVVGIIRTPAYVSFERGNTLAGSGKLGDFIYVPDSAFNMDYYTNVYVTVAGADTYPAYTDGYNRFIAPVIDAIEQLSGIRVSQRAMILSAEYTPKVENGKIELAKKEKEVGEQLAAAREQVRQIKYYAVHGEQELAAKKAEYENSLSDAQKKLYLGKSEYNAGLAEYNAKLEEYNKAKALADQHPNARADYNAAVQKLADADKQIKTTEDRIALFNNVINSAEAAVNGTDQESLNQLIERLEAAGIDPSIIELLGNGASSGMSEQVKAYLLTLLEGYKTKLAQAENDLAAAKIEYAANKKLVDAAAVDIAKLDELDKAYEELKAAEAKLKSGESSISMGELTLNMKQMQLKYEMTQAESNLALAKSKAGTVDAEYAKKEAEANDQLNNARYDIANAEKLLKTLPDAAWYVQGRDALPGNTGYGQAAENMKAFATVFPVFFFIIAALVSLTTMTRMVEEERIQLGTLKALGYGSRSIAVKYLVYALLASLIGSVIGLGVGFTVLPKAIFSAYSIMYTMPPVILKFRTGYAVAGTILAVLSTAAAALIACRTELIISPAQLMRPKAPKAGRRVLLERVDFIWKRLNFTSKVTVRNLFRNKRRFIMTIIGIAGCTALLLTGFGLGDSVDAIIGKQYGENGISMFDAQIVLKDAQNPDASDGATLTAIREDSRLKGAMLTCLKVLNGGSSRARDVSMEVNVLVPQSSAQLSGFVRLQNRKTDETFNLGDSGALITEKFADKTKTKVGDDIFIKRTDGSAVNVKVAGIVENYTFHYVYMSRAYYQATFGEAPEFNIVTAKLSDNIKAMNEKDSNAERSKLASDLMKTEGVNAVVYTTRIIDGFDQVINSLNTIILIFIIAAGALALVVLYNLSNININERKRELATIKVLGFFDREVSAYIYRENIFLTVFGTVIGLLLGIPMHSFVVHVAEVNVVMFGRTIEPSSYLLAALITVAFSTLINFIMHRKLKNVNMVESMKSVE